jgi:heat shock protein HtpX
MWQLIRVNKRNSILLMVLMAAVLLALGWVIGTALQIYAPGPRSPYRTQPAAAFNGGALGIAVAAGVWIVLAVISFSGGDRILLAASGARAVTHDVHPQLFNIVEEMKIAAGLPAMPRIYIIPDPSPNAFAAGRSPKTASLAVTAGLLGKLDRDELQGVVAHEISHILHRDIMFVTFAGIMLGSIVLLSQVFLRGTFYGAMAGRRRRYSSGGGQAQPVLMVVAIICAILAPLFAYLLYFALSRRREYLADAGAARLTRYPNGLADALEKIAADRSPQLASANKVTAPMYIVNPFKRGMALSDITSTHPPISERVKILRGMTSGVSFRDYSEAFTRATKARSVVPAAALSKESVALRESAAESKRLQAARLQARQVGDLIRTVNAFAFLTCACGLKMKIPPNYRAREVKCPRCGKVSAISRPAAGKARAAKTAAG